MLQMRAGTPEELKGASADVVGVARCPHCDETVWVRSSQGEAGPQGPAGYRLCSHTVATGDLVGCLGSYSLLSSYSDEPQIGGASMDEVFRTVVRGHS